MATGRERRAERLNERLRGAQRANVDDDSFSLDIGSLDIGGLNIGGIDLPASSSPAHDTPSSAKRRKLDSDAISAASQRSGSSARRRSARLKPKDPYDLPDTSEELAVQTATASAPGNQEDTTPKRGSATRPARNSSSAAPAASQQANQNQDELETLPAPASIRSLAGMRPPTQSPVRSRMSGAIIEEIGESPVDAPGSGKRRRVPFSEAVSSSVRLLDALTSDDAFPASSSPLVRMTRRSDATASVRSSRISFAASSKGEPSLFVDELSPDRPNERNVADDERSESRSINEYIHAGEPDIEAESPEPEEEEQGEEQAEEQEEQEEEQEEEEEEEQQEVPEEPEEPEEEPEEEEEDDAEEVGAMEAAKALGKKRARPQREISPELGSVSVEKDDEQPAPKRRRGRPSNSPATQKQPSAKQKPTKTKKRPKPQARDVDDDDQEPRPKQTKATRRRSGQSEGDDTAIEITVQRFVNLKNRGDDDADPLHTEIPFANRSGESVVDVFAQVCDEVISSTLAQLGETASNAADAAKKKECRIKMRAIEAYREELNARFLQHAIHLNHWQSLRKRLLHVQKEKLALREEIIRIRGEREQVALRMDAIRIKHEADTKESKYCLDASTLMHDVDLAVEQGRDAPELSRAAQKEAELANLELLVSRISDQASSASFSGGMLKQVQDFNAFLERAAVALETR